jgi:Aminoglycoside adenylyltransferase, C-terminal domain
MSGSHGPSPVLCAWWRGVIGPILDDGTVPAPEVAAFGDSLFEAVTGILGRELVGAYFVGSVALGGYVPGESDIDIVAVASAALTDRQKRAVASAVVEVSVACPARGVEFTLYRRDIAGSGSAVAGFEVNANGGPRMPVAVHVDAGAEPGFWYVLDRAIAHHSGLTISGPPARTIFADVPRPALLAAMQESMEWHRAHEKATLYSVLNACRAWRFAEDDVLGSKLEGAAWARPRWPETPVIDAAVALRRGEPAQLDEQAVDALLTFVSLRVRNAADV